MVELLISNEDDELIHVRKVKGHSIPWYMHLTKGAILLNSLFDLPIADTTLKNALPLWLESFWMTLRHLIQEQVGFKLGIMLMQLFDFMPVGSKFVGMSPI